MFETLFKKPLPLSAVERGAVYAPSLPGTSETADVERAFARVFSTEDGQKVLAYLQVITFQRAYGPSTPDEQLRHVEGQRSLMATILRLIDRGRK